MAKSKVDITFNSNPSIDDQIIIDDRASSIDIAETFKLSRSSNYQVEIDKSIGYSQTALNYYKALELDYNSGGLYNITVTNGNIVTIEAILDNVVFNVTSNTTGGSISAEVTNEVVEEEISIDSVVYSESDTDPCSNIKVAVTTNDLATKVTSPVTIDPNSDNPFYLDLVRGQTVFIGCENETGLVLEAYKIPDFLSVDNVSISLFGTPTGANVTVSVDDADDLTLSYSLDNTDWKTSNIFTGLVEGSYTLYVKDQYGCSVNKGFEVTVFEPDVTVFESFSYIDDSNSFRFKHDVEWDNFQTYKTIDNTLSCEELVNKRFRIHRGKQLFQTNDIITTQLLSNYEDISANIIKEDGSKESLTVVQQNQYLNLKDKRDAIFYAYSSTQTGVYFTSGNTYDYDTETITGTYSLNGNLPVYGAVNNYINILGLGWFQIREIVYDENVSANVLLIDYVHEDTATIEKVGSIYNQQNYNVYEFDVNFASYENQNVQIEILQTDSNFGEYNYLSELINVKSEHTDTLELIWYNNTDTMMFWSTGIKSKARIYFEYFQNAPDPSTDVNKTDTNVILINSYNYKTYKLEFVIKGTGLAEKMIILPLHREFYINRVKYVANGEPENENSAGTNLNTITYNLYKSNDVFNAEFNGISNVSDEIVGLIQSNDKYLALG